MNAINTYIDALEQVAKKPGLIIMGDDPLCDTLVQLHNAGMISATQTGKPDYLTRIEKCHITPSGALALFQWTSDVQSKSLFNRTAPYAITILIALFTVTADKLIGVAVSKYMQEPTSAQSKERTQDPKSPSFP